MRASARTTLAAGAMLGLAVSLTACGNNTLAGLSAGSHPAATGNAKASASPSRPATAPPPAPPPVPSTSPQAPPSATSPPPATSPASPAPATAPRGPGVVSQCDSAPPLRLSVRPAVIALACADDGLGVERMTWSDWTGATAAGRGMFWVKLCNPNCAEGKIGTYPVAVTLSDLRSSAQGPWFSRLTVSWEGARPPGTVPSSFPLMPPTS